jgi:hypothetical protein
MTWFAVALLVFALTSRDPSLLRNMVYFPRLGR